MALTQFELQSIVQVDRTNAVVAGLAEVQLRIEGVLREINKEVGWLVNSCNREESNWTAQQHERKIERRAPSLLGDGMGGRTQRDVVYSRVQELLAPLYQQDDLAAEADPMLADIIWWKADRYIVAEVSIRVDRLDVLRAAQRAQSLRKVGVAATGVVIGDEWVAEDTLTLAEDESIEWKVGNSYSPGLIEYRRIVA